MRALFFSLMMVSNNPMLFDFSKESSLSSWYIVNDGVMGGVSKGQLSLTPEGHGKFTGTVSLANNGGFTSIRCNLPPTAIASNMKISMRIKGDGKNYQFRVRHHGEVARVDVAPDELLCAFDAREAIGRDQQASGYAFVALDVFGYRTGSMNQMLREEDR